MGTVIGDPQLGLGLRTPARPLRLSRDLRNVPLEKYRLPKDGRKWKAIARDRMALAEWLATYGDADGSRIHPSVNSMIRHFGWSHGKNAYLLNDLEELDLLVAEGLTSEHGTRRRRMNLSAFIGECWTPATRPEVQDSEQESNVTLDTTVTQTGPQKVNGESNHRFSRKLPEPTPMIALSPRTIGEKKQVAKTILVEKGYDGDIVEIALLRVVNLANQLGKIPRLAAYFVTGVENALDDPEELATCRRIADQRRGEGVSIGAPLRPNEWHDAAKIALVHWSLEEGDRVGRPARELQAERLAAAARAS